jgi:hypothetical protein
MMYSMVFKRLAKEPRNERQKKVYPKKESAILDGHPKMDASEATSEQEAYRIRCCIS